jgi:hypothetical protein
MTIETMSVEAFEFRPLVPIFTYAFLYTVIDQYFSCQPWGNNIHYDATLLFRETYYDIYSYYDSLSSVLLKLLNIYKDKTEINSYSV